MVNEVLVDTYTFKGIKGKISTKMTKGYVSVDQDVIDGPHYTADFISKRNLVIF